MCAMWLCHISTKTNGGLGTDSFGERKRGGGRRGVEKKEGDAGNKMLTSAAVGCEDIAGAISSTAAVAFRRSSNEGRGSTM